MKNKIYKSEILNQEFDVIELADGTEVVVIDCTRCFGSGHFGQLGVCWRCMGKAKETRTMGTVKHWERQAKQVINETEEDEKRRQFLVLEPRPIDSVTLEKYNNNKSVALNDGLQEITATVKKIFVKETQWGGQRTLILEVNSNTLFVNQTKTLDDVFEGDTITIELEVKMYDRTNLKGSAKAGRRKLINHTKA